MLDWLDRTNPNLNPNLKHNRVHEVENGWLWLYIAQPGDGMADGMLQEWIQNIQARMAPHNIELDTTGLQDGDGVHMRHRIYMTKGPIAHLLSRERGLPGDFDRLIYEFEHVPIIEPRHDDDRDEHPPPPPPKARGKLACAGGGGVVGAPRRRGGGIWQWGSCDRTLGKVPITSNRGC